MEVWDGRAAMLEDDEDTLPIFCEVISPLFWNYSGLLGNLDA